MGIRSLSFDAKKTLKGNFKASTAAEKQFYKQLRKVAQISGHIVDQHVHGHELKDQEEMTRELERYSQRLEPWARRQSAKMLQKVQQSNKRAYNNKSKAIGTALNFGVAEEEVASVAALLLQEQVALIKSIPTEAGMRARKIVEDYSAVAFENVVTGARAEADQETIDRLTKELGLSTEVATSRAKLIAITETARANASFNQSRAMAVGSNQYRWHNSGDEAVRHSHRVYHGRAMQGQIFSWDKPPTLSDGMTGHPGTFPRCRCFAEPIFSDE